MIEHYESKGKSKPDGPPGVISSELSDEYRSRAVTGKRVGIIGLDTSHSVAFTQILNGKTSADLYDGYKVTAAYPHGSKQIESSYKRIPAYIDEVKKYDVEIVGSIAELLGKTDVILLETNDGTLHKQQAIEVLKAGKRVFIDKPLAASLADVVEILEASRKYMIPVFTTSSLRYMKGLPELNKTSVTGANVYSPAELEKTHPDLFWYGIHGVEALFTIMGTGCREVVRSHTSDTDVVIGTWADGRIGTYRGTRTGKSDYGGLAYTEEGTKIFSAYSGYDLLLRQIITYFETGIVPVPVQETLEIFAFMEASEVSKNNGGQTVMLSQVESKFKNRITNLLK